MSISIDFISSPRIITVLTPTVSITMQELVNSVRDIEDELLDLEYEHIIDASGKENLGGGVFVGISVTLRNAKLAFEARLGPGYTQCNATGGNLVAVDEYGAVMSPIQPTAFTQIILTSSSSATLQELDDIQYASFGNHVTIDVVNGVAGTTYPIGNEANPVNNLANAVTIATARGFTTLFFKSDYTFSNVDFITNYDLLGEGITKTTFTFQSGSICAYCNVLNAKVTGITTGVISFENSFIYDIGSFSPLPSSIPIMIKNCVIGGALDLPSNYSGNVQVFNCSADSGDAGAILNLGGGTAEITTRGFLGNLHITNNTNNATLSLDMNSGSITIEASCTTGVFAIRGIGVLIDNSTGTTTVDSTGLINPETINKINAMTSLIPAAL
jgi:hypothetical protein